jgi:hypothetical protein
VLHWSGKSRNSGGRSTVRSGARSAAPLIYGAAAIRAHLRSAAGIYVRLGDDRREKTAATASVKRAWRSGQPIIGVLLLANQPNCVRGALPGYIRFSEETREDEPVGIVVSQPSMVRLRHLARQDPVQHDVFGDRVPDRGVGASATSESPALLGRGGQAATAGRLTSASSPIGAIVSSVI